MLLCSVSYIFIFILSVVKLAVFVEHGIMFSDVMLSVIMLIVVRLSVILLSVVASNF
jgi:hypothetical protein